MILRGRSFTHQPINGKRAPAARMPTASNQQRKTIEIGKRRTTATTRAGYCLASPSPKLSATAIVSLCLCSRRRDTVCHKNTRGYTNTTAITSFARICASAVRPKTKYRLEMRTVRLNDTPHTPKNTSGIKLLKQIRS